MEGGLSGVVAEGGILLEVGTEKLSHFISKGGDASVDQTRRVARI